MSDAEGVQPKEGQGAQAPWAEYLDRFPEEARDIAGEVFKEWDGNVTKRFQDASQFRQQMEPFAPLVQGRTAEEIEWGLQFRDAAMNNPQAIKEWFEGFAQENGLTAQEQQAVIDEAFEDPDITRSLQSQLAPLQEQIQAITARFEAQDHQQRLQEAQSMIDTQLNAEKERLGAAFNKEAIEGLAGKYIETDPQNAITRAAQDWEHLYNQIQKETLQEKVNSSKPAPEGGGVPDGSPAPVKTMAEASRIAMEQLRGERAA